ncbi:MAG: polysaccharide deacetylase family protein [Bacteroidales bacterium]|nr:polysaccharide deacetylase family protein [Bacteroidales bacterium]
MELLIYTRNITPRVEYIFRFIFKDILRINYRITTSITEAQAYYGHVLSYSHKRIGDSLQVVPHGLLLEEGLRHHEFEVHDWQGLPAFLLTAPDSKIPFDIFSAAFYLVTRYEEYNAVRNCKVDPHCRYSSQFSMAFRNNFLHIPIIDLWAYRFLDVLKSSNYSLTRRPRKFSFIHTFDLDSAYAIKGKGLVRIFLASMRKLCKGQKPRLLFRLKVLLGRIPDPFDIYSTLIDFLPEGPQTIWFIHVGRWGKYDKSIPVKSASMRKLIGLLGDCFRIGIHPSYRSFLKDGEVKREISDLVDTYNQYVACSRQHFLRLRVPFTYRILVKFGITEDYSMGYSDAAGFRAGTCTPFVFYDLIDEVSLNLKVFPFAVMDSTLVGQGISPDQAKALIKSIINSIRSVDGTFVSVWHVDYLSGYEQGDGWFDVLRSTLNYLEGGGDAD